MSEIDPEQDELIQEFLVECYEGLDKLDQDLLTLEEDPRNVEILSGIFRTFHTIKGSAGFLAFQKLESVAHTAENLLSKLRDGALVMNTGRADALLKTVDTLREILTAIESNRSEGDADCGELLDNLKRLQQPDQDGFLSSGSRANPPSASEPPVEPEGAAAATADAAGPADGEPTREDIAAASAARRAKLPPSVAAARARAASSDDERGGSTDGLPERSATTGDELSTTPASAPNAPAQATANAASPRVNKQAAVDTSIRVDVHLLDSIMNLVGELVLTRNQIIQHCAGDPSSTLAATSQRLNLITSDLQEGVMKTRMQPIRNVWSKFPRVVRDLTQACGKRAVLVMEGEDTELDRTILEAIKDPLTHMVRNSVDHGIESSEDRRAAGKPPEGTLKLRAYHEGGQVNLELIDDGRGIDVVRVKEKAVERGLLTRERASRMSEREALQLVFLPGFSTAAKVTNVSGRGVGMDVVRTNIEKIGGTVDIQSTAGAGTTLRIKIPLTLAIIPALLVTVEGCRFAIPQVSLIELVRLEGERARDAIEHVHGTPVYRLRGQLLPLVDLREELELRSRSLLERARAGPATSADEATDWKSTDDFTLNIVVLQSDTRQYGLVVDAVNDTEEIVVKPLSQQIRDIPVYAGATILGDGRVALILDAIGIAKRAGVLDERHGHAKDGAVEAATAVRSGDLETLLLLDLDEGRAAIPLSCVARLEEIAASEIETSGDFLVAQYRDQIMPLVWLGRMGGPNRSRSELADQRFQVIVHSAGERCVGLVVDRIHDIVDARVTIERTTNRHDTLGSAVVQGRVTDLLDIAGIVAREIPSLAELETSGPEARSR